MREEATCIQNLALSKTSPMGSPFSGIISRWIRSKRGFAMSKRAITTWQEERKPGAYGYHALNWHHGFKVLPRQHFNHVLGMGSAFGDELQPVLERSAKITILEASEGFVHSRYDYVKPQASGLMPFGDDTFDLVTCLGVLHHIPNVSTVVREGWRAA